MFNNCTSVVVLLVQDCMSRMKTNVAGVRGNPILYREKIQFWGENIVLVFQVLNLLTFTHIHILF